MEGLTLLNTEQTRMVHSPWLIIIIIIIIIVTTLVNMQCIILMPSQIRHADKGPISCTLRITVPLLNSIYIPLQTTS